MELSPLMIFWLLVAGAVGVTAVSRYRPHWVGGTALGFVGLAWLVWLFLRSRLPVITMAANSSPIPFIWQFDELAWQLGGVWLLLVTAVLLAAGGWRLAAGDTVFTMSVLLLAAAGFAPLAAGNLATMLVAVTLLIGVWSAVLWLFVPEIQENTARLLPQAAWLMLSLFFLWLAAAMASGQGAGAWDMREWPTAATSSVLVAAYLLLGAWPFHGWRLLKWQLPSGLDALIHTIPAIAGLSLLARLVASNDVSLGYILFLTAFGLLGLLAGLRRVWGRPSDEPIAPALALAQANLVGLALVWVGADVAAAEARVLTLALGIIFLNGGQNLVQMGAEKPVYRRLLVVGLAVAFGAMGGFPLLAGFSGRAGLYAAWVDNGRFLLLLVAMLLHVPLATAVGWRIFRNWANLTGEDNYALPQIVGILLLTGGLFSFSGLAGMSVIAWLAVLAPIAGGLALIYFTGDAAEFRKTIRHAFTIKFPFDFPWQQLRNCISWLETAVRDAAAIWEGEGGLLWLLALLIMLLAAGSW